MRTTGRATKVLSRWRLAILIENAAHMPPLAIQQTESTGTVMNNRSMTQLVEAALFEAGIRFVLEPSLPAAQDSRLRLTDYDVTIAVSPLRSSSSPAHSPATGDVIVAEGELAVLLLADAMRSLACRNHASAVTNAPKAKARPKRAAITPAV